MAAIKTPEYELVLMLDPEASEDRREQIVSDARSRIEAAGTVKHDTAWGMRKMAFEIRQRTEADYRFFRFASDPPLLDSLDHELKIADGVLRFRIFKVDPRSPVVVPPAPTSTGAPSRPRRSDGAGDAPDAAPAPAPAAAAPAAPEAEAPAAEAESPAAPAEAPAAEPDAAPEPAADAAPEPAADAGDPPASPPEEAAPEPEAPAS